MILKKSEKDVVDSTDNPITIGGLIEDFKKFGIKPGSLLIMHSSLSKIGWVAGGAVAVISAILDVITPNGTLVMPTFSGDNSEPSYWQNPPVPEEWWDIVRKSMPAYHPEITPTRGLGIIPEVFRKWPNVIRSCHPSLSFAAWGKHAKFITKNHHIGIDLGEDSPLSRIYSLNGKILLIGVTHENDTSLHLAEYRSNFPNKQYRVAGAAIQGKQGRKWIEWEELNINSDDFEKLGADFETNNNVQMGKVGLADTRLIFQREIVDFAVKWLKKNRDN
jgi:aminoglycoside 3-N-acetyltransferase